MIWYLKFSLSYALVFALAACGVSRRNAEVKTEMVLKIECIQNHMPMSSQSSYIILHFFPADSVFQENFKVVEVIASGSRSSWTAEVFDQTGFSGKGLRMVNNNARNFDVLIGQPYDFVVVIQFESGVTKRFEVANVQITHVS